MLVSGAEILQKAHKEGYAVPGFNAVNMELAQAILFAAEEEKSPVLIQTTTGAISYAGHSTIGVLIRHIAESVSVPVALHLDHGPDFKICANCIKYGWTSVMFDGSHYSLEENISKTKDVVKMAHACGVSVEAELGRLSGIEDDLSVDEKDAMYTDPDEAKRFVAETGVDSLAIAIGTAHGKYKGVPKLDLDRLDKIKKLINIPVVLHGASGVAEDDIKRAVSLGVNKINIDTDLRVAYSDKLKEVFAAKPDEFDLRKFSGPGRDAVKEVAIGKIRLFGSAGKA